MKQGIQGLESFHTVRHMLFSPLFLKNDARYDKGENAQDGERQDTKGGTGRHDHQKECCKGRGNQGGGRDNFVFQDGPGQSPAQAHHQQDDQCQVNPERSFDPGERTDAPGHPDQGEKPGGEDAKPHPDLPKHAANLGLGNFLPIAEQGFHAYEADSGHGEPKKIPDRAARLRPKPPYDKGE